MNTDCELLSQLPMVGGAITNPYVTQQHPEFAFFDFTESERQWFDKVRCSILANHA